MIDLRSDTVTRPSQAMLAAMSRAETGDDVWGDDPTVARLQARVAEEAGKEAGLFFPSGTQSNLAAVMAHCGRGDEYLVGQAAHTYKFEGGGGPVDRVGGYSEDFPYVKRDNVREFLTVSGLSDHHMYAIAHTNVEALLRI